jgi:outer membrane protein assembly factor BamB
MKINEIFHCALAIGCLAATSAHSLAKEEWPRWRGPSANGHAGDADKSYPLKWSETENVAWKAEVPGRGHSTPVISGDQIWMTTAFEVEADPEEAKKRLEVNTGSQPLTVLQQVDLHAVCMDRKTGELLHNIPLISLQDPQWVHALNSYASPSPVLRDGRLYCHFGTFGSACVDTDKAELLWANTELQVMHENGPGSSPLIVGDRMIVHLDGSDEQMIAAFDTVTGKVAWRTDRSGKMGSNPQQHKACGSPLALEVDGKVQVVSSAASWLYGYDPETGEELWKLAYGAIGFSNVAQPVADENHRVYVPTGFGKSELIAIDLSSGNPVELWRFKKAVAKMPSPLVVDERIYMMADNGVASCIDAKSGEAIWQERVGGNFSSSPVYAGGRLYFANREGETVVLATGDEFKELSRNQLPGAHKATPVPVDGAFYIRTTEALFCIREGGAE